MQSSTKVIENYSFNPGEKTIQSPELEELSIENIVLVTNLNTAEIIADVHREGKSASLDGQTLKLEYNTSKMNASDKLQIIYMPTEPKQATVNKITDSATNQTLVEARSSRQELVIQNDSSEVLYIKFGSNATTDDYSIRLAQYEIFITNYIGRVDGVWANNSSGAARVTEIV